MGYQPFYDGHAEPDAAVVGPCALVLLGKGLKNVLFKFLPDADTGILDCKLKACSPILARDFLYPDKYRTVWPVIFDCIVQNVHQDLLQVQRVSDQSAVPQIHLLKQQPDTGLLRLEGQDTDTVFQCFIKVKGFRRFHGSAAVQLADQKHIVHQGQQVLR